MCYVVGRAALSGLIRDLNKCYVWLDGTGLVLELPLYAAPSNAALSNPLLPLVMLPLALLIAAPVFLPFNSLAAPD